MPTMLLLNSGDMPTKRMKGRKLRQCRQCEESWFSQRGVTPKRCPFCRTRAWDRDKGKAGRPPKRTKRSRKEQ